MKASKTNLKNNKKCISIIDILLIHINLLQGHNIFEQKEKMMEMLFPRNVKDKVDIVLNYVKTSFQIYSSNFVVDLIINAYASYDPFHYKAFNEKSMNSSTSDFFLLVHLTYQNCIKLYQFCDL